MWGVAPMFFIRMTILKIIYRTFLVSRKETLTEMALVLNTTGDDEEENYESKI
jgi:hypothetical protein